MCSFLHVLVKGHLVWLVSMTHVGGCILVVVLTFVECLGPVLMLAIVDISMNVFDVW